MRFFGRFGRKTELPLLRSKLELLMGVLDALAKTDMSSAENIPLFPGMTREDLKLMLNGLVEQGYVRTFTSAKLKRYYGLNEKGIEVLRAWIRLNTELVGILPVIQSLHD